MLLMIQLKQLILILFQMILVKKRIMLLEVSDFCVSKNGSKILIQSTMWFGVTLVNRSDVLK